MKNYFKRILFSTLFISTKIVFAQTAPNLGTSADFSILSSANIESNVSVFSLGKIGCNQANSSGFYGSEGILVGAGIISTPISDLQSAKLQCLGQTSTTIANNLNGLSIVSGVYSVAGSATLTDTLTFSGNATSIYIFNISDSLIIDSNSVINFGNVLPENIYWNVDGQVLISTSNFFMGIILGASNLSYNSACSGKISLLSLGGNILINSNNVNYDLNYFSHTRMTSSGGSSAPPNGNTFGTCTWSKNEGGTSTDLGFCIDVDGEGNIYVAGSFWSQATFSGNLINTNPNRYNMFVAKYSSNGNFIWINNINLINNGGSFGVFPILDIVCGNNGQVYIAGFLQKTLNFGTTTLTGQGYYIASINASTGITNWASPITTTAPAVGGGNFGPNYSGRIAFDKNGAIVFTACFRQTMNFGNGAFILNPTNTGPNRHDTFIAKYDLNGNFLWLATTGGYAGILGTNWSYGIDIDNSGNIYVVGRVSGECFFESYNSSINIYITNNNYLESDGYIVKYNPSGIVQWVQTVKSNPTMSDFSYSLDIDCDGNTYLASFHGGNAICSSANGNNLTISGAGICLTKYNPAGDLLWVSNAVSSPIIGDVNPYIADVKIDAMGSSYLLSGFNNTVTLGNFGGNTQTVTTNGGNDILISAYDNSGNLLMGSVTQIGSSLNDYGLNLGLDAQFPNTFLTGILVGTLNIGNTITSFGGQDIFLAGCVANLPPVQPINAGSDVTLCSGLATTLTATGGTNYVWSPGGATSASITVSPLVTTTYTVTATAPNGCSYFDEVEVTVIQCPFTITKTATPSQTYAGAPVDFEIEVCNNTGTGQWVNIEDFIPNDFTIFGTSSNPFPPLGPQIFLPASPACSTYHVYGFFSTVGPCNAPSGHVNNVTLTQSSSGTSLQDDACVEVLMGCPFMLWGTGTCNVGDQVTINLTGHTPVPGVEVMDLRIVYPGFLSPPATLASEFGQYHAAIMASGFSTMSPIPQLWVGVPTMSNYFYIDLHIVFNTPQNIGPPLGWVLQLPFTINSPVPTGQNVFRVFVTSPQSGLYHTDVLDAVGGNQVITGGAWTAANYLLLQNCPNVTPLDASFTLVQNPCDSLGGVTVTANYNAPGIIHNWTWGDNRTTAINGASTYTYNYLEPICSNTNYNFCIAPYNLPPIPPAAPGTYTITHTVINLVTGTSSTATQQVTIAPACCTPSAIIIPHNATSGSLPFSNYSNTEFFIEGTFIINGTFTLFNCTVHVAPGGQIILQSAGLSTALFTLNESVIEGCNKMWAGINVLAGSQLIIQGGHGVNSIVADADTAIFANHNTKVHIIKGDIINNILGVYVPLKASGINNVDMFIEGSRFGLTAATFKPYFNATPIPTKPLAGIFINDWNGTIGSINGPNDFFNMNLGIIGYRSTWVSKNNAFTNIQKNNFYNYAYNGTALTSLGKKNEVYGDLTVYPLVNTGIFDIIDCFQGVYTNRSSLDAANIKIRYSETGFNVAQSDNLSRINISSNTIYAKLSGIRMLTNSGADYVNVFENIIYIDTLYTSGLNPSGINFSEGSPANLANYNIMGNQIFGTREFRNGIFVTNVFNPKISFNIINYNSDFTSNGINLKNCVDAMASCNVIKANLPPTTAYVTRGIYNDMSTNSSIICNNADSSYHGFTFNDVCHGTNFRGNAMNRHLTGLYLTSLAVIDTQNLAGNMWYGPFTSWDANNLNNTAFGLNSSKFLVNPTLGAEFVPATLPPSNSGWFQPVSGNNYDCISEETCMAFLQDEGSRNSLLLIAQNQNISSEFEEEVKERGKEMLYDKLKNDNALLMSDVLFQNFKSANENGAIGNLYEAKINLKSITDYDVSYKTSITNYRDLISLKSDSINLLDSLANADSTLNLSVERENLITQINSLESSIHVLQMQREAFVTNKLNVATANNALVTPVDLQQTNAKIVNGIEIDYQLNGETAITNNNFVLTDVASQCPSVGGAAVFIARALLERVGDVLFYDDENTCAQFGLFRKKDNAVTGNDKSVIQIIPNPANDFIEISLLGNQKITGDIRILNVVGKTVLIQNLNIENSPVKISLSALQVGVYIVEVYSSKELVKKQKLIIVR